jgi:hypothetical protein
MCKDLEFKKGTLVIEYRRKDGKLAAGRRG